MTTTSRRGRPPGRISDPHPAGASSFDADVRIGWLLRSWRLDRRPGSTARDFAEHLVTTGCSADASRVSRWETGQLPAPLEVISCYERALRLPPALLTGLAVGLRRIAGAADPAGPSPAPGACQRALDAVASGTPTGADWLDLARCAATRGEDLLLPRALWQSIAATLVTQLGVAVGSAYVTRSEAALLLSQHPRAKQSLLYAIGNHVMNPDSLVVIDPISILQEMRDAQAADLVLRLLQQPPGPTRNGAAWAATVKLARGHFDAEQLRRLEVTVAGLIRRDGLSDGGLYHRLEDLVAALPDDARRRVLRGVTVAAGFAVTHPAEQASEVRARMAPGRAFLSERGLRLEDPMLERLIEEAGFHSSAERRFHAALVITVSPWAHRVASNTALLLEEAIAGTHDLGPDIAEKAALLLTFFAGEAQRPLLRRIIEQGPDELRTTALTAYAHLPASQDPTLPVLETLPHIRCEETSLARAALYCAGMTADPVLAEVEGDPSMPGWCRRAARWWLRQGPAIREDTLPGPFVP